MATLKQHIIVIKNKMLQISNKFYPHNGLCLLFTRIHKKMIATQDNSLQQMEKEDIQYSTEDQVADDQVYHIFLKL